MFNRKSALPMMVFGLAVCGLSVAADRGAMKGEELFSYHGCVNCHGESGKSPRSKLVPEIGGKEKDYIYDNAVKILAGKGESEEAKLMHSAFAYHSSCDAPPTDAELVAIADWLSMQ